MTNVVDLNKQRMDALCAGLPSKSAKMRRLAAAGFKRAEIARYLGVRYQFVYNVLAAAAPVALATPVAPSAGRAKAAAARDEPARCAWAGLERGGRLEVPAAFLEALGLSAGDRVQLVLEGDSLRVLTHDAALRELQAQAEPFVPDDAGLVDALLAERRAESNPDKTDG
jgi:bifunctional DNA-binding transcriptional regulator/antitoxin component of YhaV-PrlF toxin-antitoxin module